MRLSILLFNLGVRFISPLFYLGDWGKKTIIYQIKNKTKFKLRVNTFDKFAIWEIWKTNEYFGPEFGIKKYDIVVDIGAHIGVFAVYAAKNVSKGKVFAYEPNKENYNILLKNKSLNNLNNIFPFNLAISDKKGKLDLFISKLSNATHSIYEADSKKKTKVEAITLKDIFAMNKLKRINYLKIDAEGAEYNILLNTPAKIIKKIDKIVLEYHDYFFRDYNYINLKKYLEDNGFKVKVCGNIIFRRIFKFGVIKAIRSDLPPNI